MTNPDDDDNGNPYLDYWDSEYDEPTNDGLCVPVGKQFRRWLIIGYGRRLDTAK